MRFYKVLKGKGKIVSGETLTCNVCPLLGVTIDDLIANDILSEASPTIEDCVQFGDLGLAIILHQQLYNSEIHDALRAVENIKHNLRSKNNV